MKPSLKGLIAATAFAFAGTSGHADGQLLLAPTYFPDFVALGYGAVPDYIGSDDYVTGVAPAFNLALGSNRFLNLTGNYLTYNVSADSNWLFGPAALYRFGRDSDIDDPVVSLMQEIEDTVEIGAFLRYEIVDESNLRDRWSFGGHIGFDVGGEHEGYVISASTRRWLPVGRYGALGLAAALTYGSDDYTDTYFSVSPTDAALSGLPLFDAGGGLRDARVMAVFVHPLSRNWLAGAGLSYSRIMGDAADSPVVDMRGDPDQFIYGLGIGYTW